MVLDIHSMEKKWLERWDSSGLYAFRASGKQPFTIDVPPPTISGNLHMGHAFSYPHQDFIARYKRMRGYNVYYRFGFDDNGLPTERYTEKITGKRGKNTPLKEFISLCKEQSQRAEGEMISLFKRLGISSDFTSYYRTISDDTVRISQEAFLELVQKGYAYSATGPTIICPACETSISQIDMKDKVLSSEFIHIKFTLDRGELIIATTRPELLGSCVAVFVNPDDVRYRDLIGKEVTVPIYDRRVPVMSDLVVDMELGTGAEMVCTFGDQNDVYLWKKYNLETRITIAEDGTMDDDGPLKGLSIQKARERIIELLERNNLIVKREKIKHSVNVHERCDTPVEISVEREWFIKVLDLIPKLLEHGSRIRWVPEFMRYRYDNWVKGLKWDWCISRQRYYGVPFPVWYCKDCGETIFASPEELPVDPRTSPSKSCPKCGSHNVEPEDDVMDTWATSSLSPKISLSMEESLIGRYPMDIRCQANDIITTWAFTTILRSLLHGGDIPWNEILISGIVADPSGAKMSKSRGNTVGPMEVIERYGADSLRFWASSSLPWEDIRFKEQELIRGRKTVIKLYNAARLLNLLWNREEKIGAFLSPRSKYGQWIIGALSETIEKVTGYMDSYLFSRARSELDNFFWNTFCDFQLELTKYAFKINHPDRDDILQSSYLTLLAIIKMYAPIMPFITEELYETIPLKHKKSSVHLEDWPQTPEVSNFSKPKREISYIINLIKMIRSEKNKMGHKPSEVLDVELRGVFSTISDNKSVIEYMTRTKVVAIDDSEEMEIKLISEGETEKG